MGGSGAQSFVPVTLPEHGCVPQPGNFLNSVLKGFLWQHDQSLIPFPAPLLSGEWWRGGGAESSWLGLSGEQLPSRSAPWLHQPKRHCYHTRNSKGFTNCVRNRGQRPNIKTKDMPNALAKSLQSCPTLRPHRQQPTRLPHPWDSPGKNTGVGCHFLLQYMKVKSEREVAQSCPTLCNPRDCRLPGSSVHGTLQARVLEWGAIVLSISNKTA